MDIAFLALIVGLFATTLGLVRLCDALIGGGR